MAHLVLQRTIGVLFLLFSTALFLSSEVSSQETFPVVECNRTLDLIFVVDGSGSIQDSDFQLQKQALVDSINALTMGANNTRVGVVVFSTETDHRLSLTYNKQQLFDGVASFDAPGESTATFKGIQWAREQLTAAPRPNVPRAVVVLTDGKSDNKTRTAEEATITRENGIQLYAIGVGSSTDVSELQSIVGSENVDDSIFQLSNYTELRQRLRNITNIICNIEPLDCSQGVDLMFVVDGSIGFDNFQLLKNSIWSAASSFWVNFPKSRFGVVTYDDTVEQTLLLTSKTENVTFERGLANLAYPGGSGLGTDLAIDKARMMLIISARNLQRLPLFIIFITDGPIEDLPETLLAANNAKRDGMTVLAIGVGSGVDAGQLASIASSPSQVTLVDSFRALEQRLDAQLEGLCVPPPLTTTTPTPTTLPPGTCDGALDLMFVVDGSSSVGSSNFQTIKSAIRAAALYYVIGDAKTRVGVITYSTDLVDRIALTADRNDLDQEIRDLTYEGGAARNTGSALRQAYEDFQNSTLGPRVGVPKVVVVITSGDSQSQAFTAQFAQTFLTYSADASIYAMGVTNAVSDAELNILTINDATRQIRVPSYGAISTPLLNLMTRLCLPENYTTPVTTTPTITTTPVTTTPTITTTPVTTTPTTATTPTTPPSSPISTTPSAPITTVTTTPSTTPPQERNPCNSSRVVNGIGYSYDSRDCTRFYQCYPRDHHSSVTVHRKCPLGQFWDQGRLLCDEACNVECPEDPCLTRLADGVTRGMNGSCGGFWECVGGQSRPQCCPPKSRYLPGLGCQHDCHCTDACGPAPPAPCNHTEHHGVCLKKPEWSNMTKYHVILPLSSNWTLSFCQHGRFDIHACACLTRE